MLSKDLKEGGFLDKMVPAEEQSKEKDGLYEGAYLPNVVLDSWGTTERNSHRDAGEKEAAAANAQAPVQPTDSDEKLSMRKLTDRRGRYATRRIVLPAVEKVHPPSLPASPCRP